MVKTIGNVQKDAQVRAVASGALSNGDTVIVNSDGTVSAVAEVGETESIGSTTVFEAASAKAPYAVYDANAQKVVVVYRDDGNTQRGTAVVGTVSGTSISFGTPVLFDTDNYILDRHLVVYDANAQKVVVIYADDNQYGSAIVGTVSGTSISFGTKAIFNSATSGYIAATYDSTLNKVVIVYSDGGNSDYGTAIVATVSGTSISFGSEAVFNSAQVRNTGIAYDANAEKVLISYEDVGNSNYGTAIVGTVSGTSITFGTEAVFSSAYTRETHCVYDANAQKIVVVYGPSTSFLAVPATISGTSVSFGTAATIFTTPAITDVMDRPPVYHSTAQKIVATYRGGLYVTNYLTYVVLTVSGDTVEATSPSTLDATYSVVASPVYNPDADNIVVAWQDVGNSYYGSALVFEPGYSSTNLTAENFIGFADSGYADTQSAVINTTCSVDDNQTGLTAGQKYYVQSDGTLSTTAGSPTVEAGTAISPTKILVKG